MMMLQADCTLSQELAQLRTGTAAPEATTSAAFGQNVLEDDETIARVKALEAAERYAHSEENGDAGGNEADDDIACMVTRPVQEDCESVLSCCSNLYNHPGKIGDEQGPRRRSRKAGSSVSVPVVNAGLIQLSSKTGLPLGVRGEAVGLSGVSEEGSDSDADTDAWDDRVNLGQARGKGESTDDRKSRKAAVKEAKRVARQRKKESKQVFSAANTSMQHHVASNSRAQRTVVHMS